MNIAVNLLLIIILNKLRIMIIYKILGFLKEIIHVVLEE